MNTNAGASQFAVATGEDFTPSNNSPGAAIAFNIRPQTDVSGTGGGPDAGALGKDDSVGSCVEEGAVTLIGLDSGEKLSAPILQKSDQMGIAGQETLQSFNWLLECPKRQAVSSN